MKQALLTLMIAGGLPASVFAQIDLSGYWHSPIQEDTEDRRNGPLPGEYVGIPLNDAARMKADSWDAEIATVPERQCIPHPSDYGPSFSNLQMWKDTDEASQDVIAWHTHISWMAPERAIWMDGRPHPPEYAAHTWQGFSTGKWEGDILTVHTTHLKFAWIRRNGVPRSDHADTTEHFIRNGDYLTWVTIIHDPEYLTEPMIRSRDFTLNPLGRMGAYPCESVQEVDRPRGKVPNRLPGQNPFILEVSNKFGIPQEAVRGGAETIYPEYQIKLKTMKVPATGKK